MSFRILAVAALSILALSLVSPGEAHACKCKDAFSKADAFEGHTLVFWGDVVSVADDEATFKVASAFKGTKRKRKLTFDVSDDSCAVRLEKGTSYMVYARRDSRDKKTKRYGRLGLCSGTQKLAHKPISALVWTLADQPQWGVSKREARSNQSARNKLTDAASDALSAALNKCDASVWRGKKKASGHAIVRFDHAEGRTFTSEIMNYSSSSENAEEIRSCLTERLESVKFPKFPGGPVSIRAYKILDRLDASMVRQRGSANIVNHRSDESENADTSDELQLEL